MLAYDQVLANERFLRLYCLISTFTTPFPAYQDGPGGAFVRGKELFVLAMALAGQIVDRVWV